MANTKKKNKKFMQSIARKGGRKTAQLYGKIHFAKIGYKGLANRWAKQSTGAIDGSKR